MQRAPREPREQDVASWFDATYRRRGWRYLRPYEAYPVFLQLLAPRSGSKLLDVGCGPGHLLKAAVARGLVATGADLSLEATRMGRRYVPQAGFVRASSEALPFATGHFAVVTCIGAIERFLDRERALGEMQRVARDDARFCFMVRNATTPIWTVWHRLLGRRNRQGHQDAATLEAWRQLFARCGFVEQGVWPDPWPRQRLLRFLRRWLLRRPASEPAEPITRTILPLRFANEFIFVLRKRRPGEPESNARLHRLYDSLSRYNWLRRRLKRAGPGAELALRKRLRDFDLDAWLLEGMQLAAGARVVDVGCGFGATLLAWAARLPGTFVGLTPVAFQTRCAEREAARLGLGARCAFRVHDLDAPIDGTHDAAVAIESLAHAADLDRVLVHLARAVRPGGMLALVDDMAIDGAVNDDAAARELRARWATPSLPSADDFRRGLVKAGFAPVRETDLTPQVVARDASVLARHERRLLRLRRFMPFASGRDVIDAYLGGIALERLYAGGRMRYVAMLARREGTP